MQIHRSAHPRAYTVIANAALQDNRLSFVARGVLGYLLSRFDGERVDVRKLAALCKTGRDQVANALDELKAYGYYVIVREQDPEAAATEPRRECADCGRPLAAGPDGCGTDGTGDTARTGGPDGLCGPCAGRGRAPSGPAASVARDGRARVRAALAGTALAGTALARTTLAGAPG
ncbi:hypothetical protein QMK19_31035 [Streptomyces sp. H10-C2]|uniref:helix-turn-helix domain-containing protein n=1 Tax=unclassified Streptomyces TaxID=2593676 RepID=UPI0024BBB81B|nr:MULTISPECIES: helix-turn-helix domain-containing protein [unclassified Streptomyces]MDJ0344961.1 hypothetical protein [Streptomyces sp. PH10-H1]MDJ0373958.1 hypothetical protein [Streptomyces sp. H10-C2]